MAHVVKRTIHKSSQTKGFSSKETNPKKERKLTGKAARMVKKY